MRLRGGACVKIFRRREEADIKHTLIFLVFVAVVVGLLYAVSGDRSPRIPDDTLHAVFDNNAACAQCHAPGKPSALKPTHPPKDDCILCHKVKRNRKASAG